MREGRVGDLHGALDRHPAVAVIQAQPGSTSLGQLPINHPGSYSTSAVSSTSDLGSVVLGALIGVKVH